MVNYSSMKVQQLKERLRQHGLSTVGKKEEDEPEVRTEESLKDKIQDLIDLDAVENVYIELPQLNLDTVIAKNKDIHEYVGNSYYDVVEDGCDIDDSAHDV